MIMRLLEAGFLIGAVGLVLSHANDFAQVMGGIGRTYASTIKGLEGR